MKRRETNSDFEKKSYRGSDNRNSSRKPFRRGGNPNRGHNDSYKSESRGGSRFQNRRPRRERIVKGIPMEKFTHTVAEDIREHEYKALNTFHDFGFSEKLVQTIEKKGYKEPSEIQDKAIPFINVGQDVVGIADTGSGKTAAFLLPLIHRLETKQVEKALIITPTRELATQINDEFISFTRGSKFFSTLAIGGTPMRNQMYHLKKKFHVLIATPGRLLDVMDRASLNMKEFDVIVLDEVDKMFDMGFRDDIDEVSKKLRMDKQSLCFSATLDKDIEKLVRQFVGVDFIQVSTSKRETSKYVNQSIEVVREGQGKIEKLVALLEKDEVERVLVFTRTKDRADKVAKALKDNRFDAVAIHGDKRQSQRQKALNLFKKNIVSILVATDVAARGLDIPAVSHVVNFDSPENYEDYVHRIGRTGRARNIGNAVTFVDESQVNQRNEITPIKSMRGGRR